MSLSETIRLFTKMPRSTHPLVCAARLVAMLVGLNSMSWTPLSYFCAVESHPLKGRTTRPFAESITKALKVSDAGVEAQPSPNVDVPITDGVAALVTSRYDERDLRHVLRRVRSRKGEEVLARPRRHHQPHVTGELRHAGERGSRRVAQVVHLQGRRRLRARAGVVAGVRRQVHPLPESKRAVALQPGEAITGRLGGARRRVGVREVGDREDVRGARRLRAGGVIGRVRDHVGGDAVGEVEVPSAVVRAVRVDRAVHREGAALDDGAVRVGDVEVLQVGLRRRHVAAVGDRHVVVREQDGVWSDVEDASVPGVGLLRDLGDRAAHDAHRGDDDAGPDEDVVLPGATTPTPATPPPLATGPPFATRPPPEYPQS